MCFYIQSSTYYKYEKNNKKSTPWIKNPARAWFSVSPSLIRVLVHFRDAIFAKHGRAMQNPSGRSMVPGGRIELPTQGFSILCSTTELPWHNNTKFTRNQYKVQDRDVPPKGSLISQFFIIKNICKKCSKKCKKYLK